MSSPARRSGWRALVLAGGLAALVAACASAPGPGTAQAVASACALGEEAARGGVLRVAAPGGVDPARAPVPTTPAERIVFRHFYETLLRVDCRGERRPGLAAEWSAEEGGRTWRLTLRPGATFWDGTPVRAVDVVESWRAVVGGSQRATAGGLLLPGRRALRAATAAAAEVVDARTQRVRLDRPSAAPPAWLADAALAVHRPGRPGAWPQGTGAYRPRGATSGAVAPGAAEPQGESGWLVALPAGRKPGEVRPVLQFGVRPRTDPREMLDAGVEVVVTDDPEAIAYAGTIPGVRALPLPWDRTLALLSGGETGDRPEAAGAADSADERRLRTSLAEDAVRAEARPAEPGGWPAGGGECPARRPIPAPSGLGPAPLPVVARRPPPDGARQPAASGRLVYPREDATARQLAERLVALADRPATTDPAWLAGLPVAAEGRSFAAIGVALGRGEDVGYVLAFDRDEALPCGARPGPAPGWALRPLVETRRRAIVAPGVGGLAVDGDGTLLVSGGGWRGGRP